MKVLANWREWKRRKKIAAETLHDVELSDGDLSSEYLADLKRWVRLKISTEELMYRTRERYFRESGITL